MGRPGFFNPEFDDIEDSRDDDFQEEPYAEEYDDALNREDDDFDDSGDDLFDDDFLDDDFGGGEIEDFD